MKTHLIISIALLFLSSCFPVGDLLPDFEAFTQELSLDAKQKCVKENPKLTIDECNVKHCLASPLTLVAMQDLLIETAQVLNEIGITWFLDSGSTIAAERFHAHLPYDDDVDLGVFKEDLTKSVVATMETKLRERGFDFKPLFGSSMMQNITGYQGLIQVAYGQSRFYRLILSEKPNINKTDLHNLWMRYSNASSMLPHLDIFSYEEKSPGNYIYTSKHFTAMYLKGKTIPKKILLPTKQISVLGQQFPTINNFIEYGKLVYHTDDLTNNFYINRNHSAGCKAMNFPDIRQHPETLNFLLDYLAYSYSRPAAKALNLKFDRDAVYKIYFP